MIYLVVLLTSLLVATIEAVSYPGFIQAHIHIPAYIIYIVSLMVAMLVQNSAQKKYLKPLAISSLVVYICLIILENTNYPNFIYSMLHVNLLSFRTLLFLMWTHFMISLTKKDILGFTYSFLVSSLIFFSSYEVGTTIGFIITKISFIIDNPTATYRDKVGISYKGFYPAMELVKELTPPSSLILIPPRANPWEVEGNTAMVRYFLYPRIVRNLEFPLNEPSLPTYILIAHGSWKKTGSVDYGWPKVIVNSDRIWEFDTENDKHIEYLRSYNPSEDEWDWGLIEVPND